MVSVMIGFMLETSERVAHVNYSPSNHGRERVAEAKRARVPFRVHIPWKFLQLES